MCRRLPWLSARYLPSELPEQNEAFRITSGCVTLTVIVALAREVADSAAAGRLPDL
jgi:hypothetical protein